MPKVYDFPLPTNADAGFCNQLQNMQLNSLDLCCRGLLSLKMMVFAFFANLWPGFLQSHYGDAQTLWAGLLMLGGVLLGLSAILESLSHLYSRHPAKLLRVFSALTYPWWMQAAYFYCGALWVSIWYLDTFQAAAVIVYSVSPPFTVVCLVVLIYRDTCRKRNFALRNT